MRLLPVIQASQLQMPTGCGRKLTHEKKKRCHVIASIELLVIGGRWEGVALAQEVNGANSQAVEGIEGNDAGHRTSRLIGGSVANGTTKRNMVSGWGRSGRWQVCVTQECMYLLQHLKQQRLWQGKDKAVLALHLRS